MTTARCPTCDREGCDSLKMPGWAPYECACGGFDCPLCRAAQDCERHAVDWRARALAAEADKSCRVCDRVDAMTYACEPSWEKTRADATRWRKVAPLIANLHRAALIGASHTELIAAVAEVTAATQEPTP